MSAELWGVHEHVIPASHVRGFSRGIRDEHNGRLRLSVKQYVPRTKAELEDNAATLIMLSGIGASKEIFEPFFDELLQGRFPIRAIWSLDTAHHGASYLLNEKIIGDEPNWFDASRDLLQMINHFQELMPPPLYGIGHSLGGVPLLSLSVFHPRLLTGLVLFEPTVATTSAIRKIDRTNKGIDRSHRATAMLKRKDIWPSLQKARERLRATPHYGPFDPRVFELVMKYDLRPAPSERCDEVGSSDAVTLTTPKSMEVGSMMRPDPPLAGYPEAADFRNRPEDMDTTVINGFYRGEVVQVYRDLPYILPSILLVWGSRSFGGTNYAKEIAGRVGIGYGGNGGLASGRVHVKTVDNGGHNIPLDTPGVAAEIVGDWIRKEHARWETEADERSKEPGYEVPLKPEVIRRIAKL